MRIFWFYGITLQPSFLFLFFFSPPILQRPCHPWVLGHWSLRVYPRQVPRYACPHFTFNLGLLLPCRHWVRWSSDLTGANHLYVLLLTHRLGGLQSFGLNWLAQWQTKSYILFTCHWNKPYSEQTNTLGHSTLKLPEPGDYRHQNLDSSSCSFASACTTSISAEVQYKKKTTIKKCALSFTASTLLQQTSPRVKRETKFPFFPAKNWDKTWYFLIQDTV